MSLAGSTMLWRRLRGVSWLLCGALCTTPLLAQQPPADIASRSSRPDVSADAAPVAASTALATPDAVLAGFDWRVARGVLFRVRAPHGSEPDNLLFGTIHVGTPEELGLDLALVGRAVQARQTLVNEVDGAAPWDARYDHYRFLADGQNLAKLIGGLEFIELGTLLPEHDGAQLGRLKPWVAMTLLEEGQTWSTAQGVDHQVEDMARVHGLRLVHLETLEDQLAALDCTLPDDYALVLKQRLADPQQLRTDTSRALAFYRAGDLAGWRTDIDAMRGLDQTARAVESRARHCLLAQRNARWLEELQPLLSAGGCFVAVGAMHLTGPDGLLAGLARRGFDIRAQAW